MRSMLQKTQKNIFQIKEIKIKLFCESEKN